MGIITEPPGRQGPDPTRRAPASGPEDAPPRPDPFGLGEPGPVVSTSNGAMTLPATSDAPAVDAPTHPTGAGPGAPPVYPTVVVGPNRRVAHRMARRIDGPTAMGVVESVRTDVDPVYRSRAIVTAAALVACFVVFGWALSHAWDAVSEIFEVLFAPFR